GFLERVEVGQQANVIAELVNGSGNAGEGADDLRIDLPRIGLAGHGERMVETESARDKPVELLDLLMIAVKQSEERRLSACRTLDAAELQRLDPVFDLFQVDYQILRPEGGPLADGSELGRLKMRVSQRRKVL